MMKTLLTRAIAIVIVILLVVTGVPLGGMNFTAKAEDDEEAFETYDRLTYDFNEETGVLTISGNGQMNDYGNSNDVEDCEWSPFYVSEYDEESIEIKRIIIEEGVTSIGSYVFENQKTLTEVQLAESVTLISDHAFEGCSSIKEITIPSGVRSILPLAFECGVKFTVAEDNPYLSSDENGSLYNKDKTVLFYYSDSKNSTEAVIADTVERIRSYAFYNCNNLTSIVIPENVKTIDSQAFYCCVNLANVVLPDGLETIGSNAFEDCNIKEINISEDIIFTGENPFSGSEWYNSFLKKQNNGVVYIGKNAVDYKGEIPKNATITIKEGTISVSNDVFSSCENLKNVTIPDSVKYFDADNISQSQWFEDQPDGPVYLNGFAVGYKDSKKIYACVTTNPHIAFEKGIKAIASTAICGGKYDIYDTSVEKITLPDGLESIGNNALTDLNSLEEISIPDSVEFIGDEAFHSCGFEKIFIPSSVKSIGYQALGYYIGYGADDYWGYYRDQDFTIYGIKGSAAEKYAKENCFNFVEHTKHTIVTTQAKAPTYTADGITEGKKCSVCDYVVEDQKNVPKKTLGTTSKITTTQTTSSVTLKWNKVTGATGYRVYQKVNDGWKTLAYTTNLTYTIKSLKANTKYNFAVKAYTLDGKTKVFAPKYKSVSVTTSKAGLGTTSKITATKTSSSVTLKWNKVTGATGYRVYQKVGSKWKVLVNTTKLTYTVKNLKAGTKYTFAVRAYVTKSGKTTLAPKYKSLAVTTAKASAKPAQVKNLKATPTATTVKLTWSKVSGVKGYEVFSYNSKTKKYISLGKTTGTSYTVKNRKANTAYSYAVQAYKVSGKNTIYGKVSSVVKVTTLLATPTVKISSTKGKANLTWNNIAGESGYAIYMATSKNGKYTHLANYKANSTKATKSKLKSGKTYYFKIRAYKKASGKTTYSAYSTVKSIKIK